MKPALFVTLSFLIFALTSNLSLAVYDSVVRDTGGQQIFYGNRYNIMPVPFHAEEGGVKLGRNRNSTCPVTVVQDSLVHARGLKVQISIPGISPGIVFIGTAIDITFDDKPGCATSSKWVVVADDFPAKWVGIGGAQDHPGKQVITGTFNVQTYDDLGLGYKLVFCPTATTRPRPACSDIGTYDDGNGKRLILTNATPFKIEFIRTKD